jgi:hypothetical protein
MRTYFMVVGMLLHVFVLSSLIGHYLRIRSYKD